MLVLLWICGLQILSPGGNFFHSPIRALRASQVAQQLDLPPNAGDLGSSPGSGRSLKEENDSPKHAAPYVRHGLAIQFLHDSIHDPERCCGEGGGRGFMFGNACKN